MHRFDTFPHYALVHDFKTEINEEQEEEKKCNNHRFDTIKHYKLNIIDFKCGMHFDVVCIAQHTHCEMYTCKVDLQERWNPFDL